MSEPEELAKKIAKKYSYEAGAQECADEIVLLLRAQQAKPVVDDAMVERFCANMYGWWGDGDTKSRDRALKHVHIALTAALSTGE